MKSLLIYIQFYLTEIFGQTFNFLSFCISSLKPGEQIWEIFFVCIVYTILLVYDVL